MMNHVVFPDFFPDEDEFIAKFEDIEIAVQCMPLIARRYGGAVCMLAEYTKNPLPRGIIIDQRGRGTKFFIAHP